MTRTSLFRRPTALRRVSALGLLTVGGLAVSAAPAFASGETITLTQTDPTAVVGHAVNYDASGLLNPNDVYFGFDVYIFVKNADVDPTCAADEATEGSNAIGMGSYEAIVSPIGGFQVGTGPSFNTPFKVSYAAPGHFLFCGYVVDDWGDTMATGQLNVTAAAAPVTTPTTPTPPTTTTPAKPTTPTTPTVTPATHLVPNSVRAPWVTLSRHVLSCHAGIWLNKPTRYGYAWYVKGSSRRLASGSTLRVKASLRGRQVMCKVTGSNSTGSTTIPSKAIRAR